MNKGIPMQQIIRYFIYGILALLLASLLYFWIFHGMATITVSKNDNITDEVSVKSVDAQSKEANIFRVGDLYFVPRSAEAIRVVAGKYETLQGVKDLPFFSVSKFSVPLYKDKNASKVASNAPGCASYSRDADRIVSYDCNLPSHLLHFDPASWQNTEVAGMASNTFAISPYQGGVIGVLIGQETDSPIFIVDSIGKTSYLPKPESLSNENLDEVSVITDTSSENDHFLLKTRNGTLYYGDGNGTYTKFDPPDGFSAEFDAMYCSLVQEVAYCYHGPSSDSEDSQEAVKHGDENPIGRLEVINTSTKNRQNFDLDKEGIDTIAVTRDGHVYGLARDLLYSIKEPDQEPHRLFISSGVTAIAANENLYFNRGDALYKSKALQSYKIFSSDNVQLSSIFALDDTVLFNGYLKKAALETLHTFQLTEDINDGAPRLVDRMPLAVTPSIISSDFYKQMIRLQIFASITSDRQTGITTYDEGEFEANKQQAFGSLEAQGIDPDGYSLIFSP